MTRNPNRTTNNSPHRTNKTALRNLIIVIAGGILVAAGVVYALKSTAPNKEPETEQPEQTEQQPAETPKPTTDTKDKEEKPADQGNTTDKTPSQSSGSNPNEATELTGAITHSTVDENKKLTVRINIDQKLSGGKCEIWVGRKDELSTYYAEVNVSTITTSTCEGFDLDLSASTSGDYWYAILVTASDGRLGEFVREFKI